MCGACGRVVVADPVFPDGRTTRGNLVAGQMIERICAGRVTVRGRADGFVVSAPGRRSTLCATVADVWAAVHTAARLDPVLTEVEARYASEQALFRAVVEAGRAVAS